MPGFQDYHSQSVGGGLVAQREQQFSSTQGLLWKEWEWLQKSARNGRRKKEQETLVSTFWTRCLPKLQDQKKTKSLIHAWKQTPFILILMVALDTTPTGNNIMTP